MVFPWQSSSPAVLLIAAVISLACCDRCVAQLEPGIRVDARNVVDHTTEDASDAGDLDALLELADEDVGRLSQVKVAAPALQEVVSTVSRQKSTVGRSPAAVFVITNEMIRRSGARSIPEVLRLAPGVQVAKIDANKWAISIRGFNNRFANKLLVQIDGRSVYTPLFAGTFWDVQDVLLEDVERIEVIRGPGATVWGANAVNGVINVITKSAKDTQGVFSESGGGTDRAFGSARFGGNIGNNLFYRGYGKWFERDGGFAPGGAAHDDWRMGRGGLRIDWEPNSGDTVTFQGDYYDGYTGRRNLLAAPTMPPAFVKTVDDDAHVAGGNMLFRFTRVIDDDSDWSLQFYYDRTERHFLASAFEEDRDTIDIDFQHRFAIEKRHAMIWGLAYRYNQDSIENEPFFLSFDPRKREFDRVSGFVQDEITLYDDLLYLTVGTKLSHNDFTGPEYQPSARLLWTPTDRHSIWASVSRAVRTPSRAEDDVRITLQPVPSGLPSPFPPVVFPVAIGNRDVDSEVLLAYEFGFRYQPTEAFSWDLAVFFHDYDNLVSNFSLPGTIGPEGLIAPLAFGNGGEAQSYGFDFTGNVATQVRREVFGGLTLRY